MKILLIVLQLVSLGMFAQNEAVTFKKQADKLDVLIGGKYFTSYYFFRTLTSYF